MVRGVDSVTAPIHEGNEDQAQSSRHPVYAGAIPATMDGMLSDG